MDPALAQESEKLLRSWMQHDATTLRDYLVAGVEDPQVNLQSILSRHFLVRELVGGRFEGLMGHECRFAAAMNWLLRLAQRAADDEMAGVLYALRHRADNAEGIEIPAFVARTFQALPAFVPDLEDTAAPLAVPNYVADFLTAAPGAGAGLAASRARVLDTFCDIWRGALARLPVLPPGSRPLKVLEPACGSANDYRVLRACGLAGRLEYTGFDLCPKNVANASEMFPGVRFATGNVFEIASPDQAYDVGFVHDLFEHLSLAGLETAVAEICRVTRHKLAVGFFNMDEIPAHVVRPVAEYHWNRLSMARMQELFARQGFRAQVVHIGTFLRRAVGCDQTHNPNAYTFHVTRHTD